MTQTGSTPSGSPTAALNASRSLIASVVRAAPRPRARAASRRFWTPGQTLPPAPKPARKVSRGAAAIATQGMMIAGASCICSACHCTALRMRVATSPAPPAGSATCLVAAAEVAVDRCLVQSGDAAPCPPARARSASGRSADWSPSAPICAASTSRTRSSSGTGSGFRRRIARQVRMISNSPGSSLMRRF